MDVGQRTQQQQTQTLSAEQLFSLNILQMSVLELSSEIRRETEENPVLEIDETAEGENSSWPDDDVFLLNRVSFKEQTQAREDSSYKNIDFSVSSEPDDKFASIQKQKTLKDYLYEQLGDLVIDKKCARLCGYIIESIDRRGYLDYKIHDLAKDLSVSAKEASEALKIVKDFQPVGIASANLQECLITQLKKDNIFNAKLSFIIEDCLSLIASNKIKHISKKAGITVNEAVMYCNIIKSLHPYPAEGFHTGDADIYIVPDAYITENDGGFNIVMNERSIPSLVISGVYKDILKHSKDLNERNYIKERLNRATSLIRGIEHRKSTLTTVFELIAQLQWEYLKTGRNLKPMTLKMLAEKLEVHESTMSRAIKGKYILSPTGLIYVKDLFSSSLELSKEGGQLSSTEVKNEIKRLIENEANKNPLSDLQIRDELGRRNIIISRRTVAKYREAMNIGSSAKRRTYNGRVEN